MSVLLSSLNGIWNLIAFFVIITSFQLSAIHSGQSVDTSRLNDFFNSLEKRNEAMGSITILQDGKLLFQRAIGHRFEAEGRIIPSGIHTKYRIWSISKTYTATMIMQLIEEERLSLQTTLDHFYPDIPYSKSITIKDMLGHRSGIYCFANDSEPDQEGENNIEKPLTHKIMVSHIAKNKPNFKPGERMKYSNSNYLLLGYIIETLDNNLYEVSLRKRISSKIGLTNTYFGVGALDTVENKAHSYTYDGEWIRFNEGEFSGLIPAGAGGIVSTTYDMAYFIDALFAYKLISKNSLDMMIDMETDYGLGIMKANHGEPTGFGHTGGYIASESSLMYFPEYSLSIAYSTNGIVYPKERILQHVLQIYNGGPFGISINKRISLGISLIIFALLILALRFFTHKKNIENTITGLAWSILILFTTSILVGGFIHGGFDLFKDSMSKLTSFYSCSGSLMSVSGLLLSFLTLLLGFLLFNNCKKLGINLFPLMPIIFVIASFLGQWMFADSHLLTIVFANIIILIVLSPILVMILWRHEIFPNVKKWPILNLALMLITLTLFICRPLIPDFMMRYSGLIQFIFQLAWCIWLIVLTKICVGDKCQMNRIKMT